MVWATMVLPGFPAAGACGRRGKHLGQRVGGRGHPQQGLVLGHIAGPCSQCDLTCCFRAMCRHQVSGSQQAPETCAASASRGQRPWPVPLCCPGPCQACCSRCPVRWVLPHSVRRQGTPAPELGEEYYWDKQLHSLPHNPPLPASLLTLLSLQANDSRPSKQPLGPHGPSPFSVQRSRGQEKVPEELQAGSGGRWQ